MFKRILFVIVSVFSFTLNIRAAVAAQETKVTLVHTKASEETINALSQTVARGDIEQFDAALKAIRNKQVSLFLPQKKQLLEALRVALKKQNIKIIQALIFQVIKIYKNLMYGGMDIGCAIHWDLVFFKIIDDILITDFNEKKLLLNSFITYIETSNPAGRLIMMPMSDSVLYFETYTFIFKLFKKYVATDYLDALLAVLQESSLAKKCEIILGNALYELSRCGNIQSVIKIIKYAEDNKNLKQVLAWQGTREGYEYRKAGYKTIYSNSKTDGHYGITNPPYNLVAVYLSVIDVARQNNHQDIVKILKEAQSRTTCRYAIAQLFARVSNAVSQARTRVTNWLSNCTRRLFGQAHQQ